jgi:hypothetical protein
MHRKMKFKFEGARILNIEIRIAKFETNKNDKKENAKQYDLEDRTFEFTKSMFIIGNILKIND